MGLQTPRIAKLNAGDDAGAIEDHTKVIELDPSYALAYRNRGVAKMKAGDPKGAALDYEQALRLNPTDSQAGAMRAFILKHLGRGARTGG